LQTIDYEKLLHAKKLGTLFLQYIIYATSGLKLWMNWCWRILSATITVISCIFGVTRHTKVLTIQTSLWWKSKNSWPIYRHSTLLSESLKNSA